MINKTVETSTLKESNNAPAQPASEVDGLPVHSIVFIVVSLVNFALAIWNLLFTRKVKKDSLKRQSKLKAFDTHISDPIMTALTKFEEAAQNIRCLRLKSNVEAAKEELQEIGKPFSACRATLQDTIERVRETHCIFDGQTMETLNGVSESCMSIVNDINASSDMDTFTSNMQRFSTTTNRYCNLIRSEIQACQDGIFSHPSKAITASTK